LFSFETPSSALPIPFLKIPFLVSFAFSYVRDFLPIFGSLWMLVQSSSSQERGGDFSLRDLQATRIRDMFGRKPGVRGGTGGEGWRRNGCYWPLVVKAGDAAKHPPGRRQPPHLKYQQYQG